MKIKYKLGLAGLILTSLIATSCDDFLELEPISKETTADAYKKASQVEAALVGVYESFQSSEYYVWDNVLLEDVRSDNYYAGGDDAQIFTYDHLTITPTNTRLFSNWGTIYNAIAKANTVLAHVDECPDPELTDARRKVIRGEALFLRAYHYFNLVKLWGGVPLILNEVTSTAPEDVNVPRSTAEEVYAQILTDLDEAITLLPDVYGSDASVNKARATAGAANALAAKVCAQMPTPDYARALDYIDAVEKSEANYTLLSDYAYLFDGNHYNNDESILEVQFTGGNEGNWGPQMTLPPSISGDSWRKFVTPSHDLVNAYNTAGDTKRLAANVIFEEVNWADEYWYYAVGSSIPFAYKWKIAGGWASTDRQYILRYGDIVLLKAEALNETNDLSGAVTEVNRIRKRAGLLDLTTEQKSSKEVLKATILNERRLELAQEACRWDDLVRYGVVISTMNNLVEIDLSTNKAVDYNMTEAKILLPIPQQELDRNSALVQNPL
jgi:starch-binding outer membrane protein, SusD/RagB family